jgi:transient receptor potential cation channel subfamily V protein 5
MFKHVLRIERKILWTYGDVVCASYPLGYIDTVDQQTGQLNDDSALAQIVYGVHY